MSINVNTSLMRFFVSILVFVGFSSLSMAQIHVQTNAANIASNVNVLAFNSANQAGNLIIAEIDWDSSALFDSISDSKGNVYTQIGSEQTTSFGKSRLYYAKYINAGANIVTSRVSGGPGFHELFIHEYSGLDTASPLDSFSVSTAGGSSFSSGNVTTHFANDLLYGIEIDAAAGSASSGWETRSTYDANIAADMISSTTGTYAFTGTSSTGSSVAWLAAFKIAGGGSSTTPTITGLSPNSGLAGASVTISGSNFGATQGMSTVALNGTAALPTSWSATSITITVPSGATTGSVVVTVGGVASNGASFAVTGGSQSWAHVQTNSANISDNTNGVVFPSANQAGDLIVAEVDWDGSATFASISDSMGNVYTQIGAEQITSFGLKSRLYYAKNVSAGTNTVTTVVSGSAPTFHELYIHEYSGVDAITPLDSFSVNAAIDDSFTSGNVTTNSANELLYGIELDSGAATAGSGWIPRSTLDSNVAAEMNAPTAGSYAFTGTSAESFVAWVAAFKVSTGGTGSGPSITSLSTTSGVIGDTVTITGTNFGNNQGTNFVSFNGTNATVNSWSSTTIVVQVPNAISGNITVTVGGIPSNGINFTIGPVLTGLSTSSGPVGTIVVITGTNFGSSQGNSVVTFNGLAAKPSAWNSTSITAEVPCGATTGNVQVTVNGRNTSGLNFAVQTSTPSIATLTPTSGFATMLVTITGTNFGGSQGTCSVKFNGVSVPATTSWNSSQIVVPVPTGVSTGPVTVTSGGTSSNGVNFTLSSAPQIGGLSPNVALRGQVITITGTNFGATQPQGATLTFNGIVAAPTSWSDTVIQAQVPSTATTGQVLLVISGFSSNGVAFTVLPEISNLMPSSAVSSASVTIVGHDFGSSQPSGSSVTFHGISAAISTWTSNTIVAIVPSGATSGQVLVNVGSVATNSLPFTVASVPAITSVSPTSGVPGTQITIAGSGFGATQGTGSLLLGTVNGVVVSWNDTQIIANVAANTRTGSVQIGQSGSTSNAVPFTVNAPIVTAVNPASGVAGTTTVTISGSGFGSTQGNGNIWLGSTYGVVSSWTDTQIVASVAASAKTGTVKILQNNVWSVPTQFSVSSGSNPTITISPSTLSMIVGETHRFSALNSSGTPATGLSWSSSNSSIASISSGDSPIVTAVSPGHVTITAGDGVADVFVSAGLPPGLPGGGLPIGTVKWSIAGAVSRILPAIPTLGSVVDVFAEDSAGNVQAATSNGNLLWSAGLGTENRKVADFLGGLLVVDTQTIKRVNGSTGQVTLLYTLIRPCDGGPFGEATHLWYYCASDGYVPMVLDTGGTIFLLEGDTVTGIDETTGTVKFQVPIEHSTEVNNASSSDSFSWTPSLITMGGDGYAYVPYVLGSLTDNGDGNGYSSHQENHFQVLRVGPNGDSSKIPVRDIVSSSSGVALSNGHDMFWGSVSGAGISSSTVTAIPNADQGILLSWQETINNNTTFVCDCFPPANYGSGFPETFVTNYRVTAISASGITADNIVNIPGADTESDPPVVPVVQKEDGSFFGTMSVGGQKSLVSLSISGGVSAIATGDYQPLIATADGGVIAQRPDGSTVAFNTNESATGDLGVLPTYSWGANAYQLGSLDSVVANIVGIANSRFAIRGGNVSQNGTPIQQIQSNKLRNGFAQLPDLSILPICGHLSDAFPHVPTCGNINAIELLTDKSPDFIFQTYLQTYLPVTANPVTGQKNNDIMSFTTYCGVSCIGSSQINVTGVDQRLTIRLRGSFSFDGLVNASVAPFDVATVRFDPVNHIIAAVTLTGHPLRGWRYWRVYSIGTNDVVVETGAYDQPGPLPQDYLGYFWGLSDVSGGWKHYLQFIQNDLHAAQGTHLKDSLNGIPLTDYGDYMPNNNLLEGYWDLNGDFTDYIMNNICQSTSCP